MMTAIKKNLAELTSHFGEEVEKNDRQTLENAEKVQTQNFFVKASMAKDLHDLGLSEQAIGRVLHISIEDVEEILKHKVANKRTRDSR